MSGETPKNGTAVPPYHGRAMKRPLVLIVDDDPILRRTLELLLRDSYDTASVKDGKEAVEAVRTQPIDMVLMDVKLPGMDGIRAMEMIREFDAEAGIVMISGLDSAQQAVSAMKKGAYDYITKPFDNDDLLLTLNRYFHGQTLKKEVDYLKEELKTKAGYGEIVSIGAAMREVFDFIEKVARTTSNVLITGESGTGKELVACAIHTVGDRKDKPFVAVNCGAVPSELMESELFGHEKGAFTGAHARKIGKFEYADGGTIFFDEIATLPMNLQVKLLRVLQEKRFERVGGNVFVSVDIRVIAATNADLLDAVKGGRFREDLYYRLHVVPIKLPPLRERREDIPLLVEHFIAKHSKKCNKAIGGISPEALNTLCGYLWPGNVRELENLVERLVVLGKDGVVIRYEDLPVGMHIFDRPGHSGDAPRDYREACRSFERYFILGVLNKTNWNRVKAADLMKIHRNTLLMKMKYLGIKDPEARVFRKPFGDAEDQLRRSTDNS